MDKIKRITRNREVARAWLEKNRDRINEKARQVYAASDKTAHQARNKRWYEGHRNEINERARARHRERREAAISHYSGGSNSCACCGDRHMQFLCVDHNHERKRGEPKLGGSGYDLYLFLQKAKYPPGFRVLCHNCNMAIGFYGRCPHEEEMGNEGSDSGQPGVREDGAGGEVRG